MRTFLILSLSLTAVAQTFVSESTEIILDSGNKGYEGGVANTLLSFDVQTFDSDGQAYTTSVSNLTWQITTRDFLGNPEFFPTSSVLDNFNGIYTIAYTMTTPGDFRLMVKGSTTGIFPAIGGNINGGSSLFIRITAPAPPASTASTASGPGVTGNARASNQWVAFTIQARAADGTALSTGGANFAVHAFTGKGFRRHETKPAGTVADNGDGTYSAQYWVEKQGWYEVQVTIDAQPIQGSPFDVRWKPTPGPLLTLINCLKINCNTQSPIQLLLCAARIVATNNGTCGLSWSSLGPVADWCDIN